MKVIKSEDEVKLFVANFLKKNILFRHGIFRSDVEKQLMKKMRRFGAGVV